MAGTRLRVGRWMSRAEYDAMVATGRMQPTVEGVEMKHVTYPADPEAFRAAAHGSLFAEFDIIGAQTAPGGRSDWLIVYGANSTLGRLAARRGTDVSELPAIENVIIREGNLDAE